MTRLRVCFGKETVGRRKEKPAGCQNYLIKRENIMKANLYIVPAAIIAALIAMPAQAKAKNPPVIKGSCSIKPSTGGKPPVINGSCTTTPPKPKKVGGEK